MGMNVNKTQGERSQQGQESPTDAFLGSGGETFLSHVGIRKGSTDLTLSMDIVASYALFIYLFTCSLGGGRNRGQQSLHLVVGRCAVILWRVSFALFDEHCCPVVVGSNALGTAFS